MDGSLAQVLETALTRPADLTPAALDTVVATLDPRDATAWASPLAAILYARPDLAGSTLIERLGALLEVEGVTDPVVDVVSMALTSFAGSDLAAPTMDTLLRLLPDEALTPASRAGLVSVLRAHVSWSPELLDVQRLLDLAARPCLDSHRGALLGQMLEPLLAHAPERVTDALLQRILTVFEGCARLPYALQMIADRAGVAASVRQRAAGLTAPAFPARAGAHALLTRQPFHVLAVLNVRIGQGDEIVRLVALLQALLDINPGLHVTLVTTRTHLYDHVRVRTIPIRDPAALEAALGTAYDGIIHVREPGWPEVAWNPPVDARVRDLVATGRPALVVTADVGSNHFVYRAVEVNGRDMVVEHRLDRLDVHHVYDGCSRLLAVLGLRTRVGEERPTGPSVLTGVGSVDAERAWARLTATLSSPIALVNPYGGIHWLKGYPPDRPEGLVVELSGLVNEGYGVVLLPNGTPWGSGEAADRVLSRLPPAVRRRVVVAPDPAAADQDRDVALTERPELSHADRTMRLFKYFTASADLVVTVEGWMAHLAYALGRPFRLVLQAQSGPLDWCPSSRSPRQRLARSLSPAAGPIPPETLTVEDPPALPPKHRKPLFEAALAGLPALGSRAVPMLVRALASDDLDVRATAIAALGRFLPAAAPRGYVLAALADREPGVRRTAAEALLADGTDCARELGPRARDQLLAHRAIALQDWTTVRRLGTAALPALFVAADGANGPVSREARWIVARVLAELRVGSLERRERDRDRRPRASP